MNDQRVVVIAGATSPTGQTIARRFSAEKASLALFSRDGGKLSSLRDELSLPCEQVLFEAFDFRQGEAAKKAAQLVKEKFQRCDILSKSLHEL
ncbi:MAG: SDR family NAD(P)-dependent oxidoreductase [Anaerolineales bacterium]|nr:SDR family NAD(P)-dependent oxidoreductase [Anaerolineales bacterium]